MPSELDAAVAEAITAHNKGDTEAANAAFDAAGRGGLGAGPGEQPQHAHRDEKRAGEKRGKFHGVESGLKTNT